MSEPESAVAVVEVDEVETAWPQWAALPTDPPIETAKRPAVRPARAPQSLFRTVWRWHFYAGVLVAPVLVVMAVTGGLYVFRAEVEEFSRRDLVFVAPGPGQVGVQAQVDAAAKAHPGWVPASIRVHPDSNRATVVALRPPGNPDAAAGGGGKGKHGGGGGGRRGGVEVYVNPQDGRVLGSVVGEGQVGQFFRTVLTIHRSLWAGTTGRILTELTTCWSIVLCVTGVYLWWPKGKKPKAAGVWTVRLKAKLYTMLRDLHAVGGVYLLPVIGVILVTGLFYTWGVGTVIHKGAHAWVGEDAPVALARAAKPKPSLPLDQLVATVQDRYPGRIVTATLAPGGGRKNAVATPPGSIRIGAGNDFNRTYGPMVNADLTLDRATGRITGEKTNGQTEFFWHAWTYPLHVGSFWGAWTKVVWLVACVALALLPVTGLWMWWERRPKGRSGLPRRPEVKLPIWLIVAIAALGVVLPVMGVSMLLLLAGEAAWTGVQRLRQPRLATA